MYWNPFRCKVPQLVGIGVRSLLGTKLKEFGCKKILVMYDKDIADCGATKTITDLIADAGFEYVVYDKVQLDPPDHIVDDAAAFSRESQIDGRGRRRDGYDEGYKVAAEQSRYYKRLDK